MFRLIVSVTGGELQSHGFFILSKRKHFAIFCFSKVLETKIYRQQSHDLIFLCIFFIFKMEVSAKNFCLCILHILFTTNI